MSLSVIGAGFGRTGTESLKLALEALGLGPCHHMSEVLRSPEQLALWRRIASGEVPDWEATFNSYRSCVDWPSSYYWRQLSKFYPDAKIILSVRSSESWYESFSKTILPLIRIGNDPDSFGEKVVGGLIFGGRPDDRTHAIRVYEENSAEVKRSIPHSRLLIYELGSGWQPLCEFLGAPVPQTPYPKTNSLAQFLAMVQAFRTRNQ